MNIQYFKRTLTTFSVLVLITLAGCSGGAATTQNPVTSVAKAATYSGPPPATADVQAFMVNLWANVNPTNRCGGCHTQGGQSPQFARTDDVNLAYAAGTNPTVAVTFTEGLPQSYGVFATASGNFPVSVSNKTSSGFTLTIVGTVAAAGTVDVLVVAA